MKKFDKLLIVKIITSFILSVILPYTLTFFFKLDRSYILIFIFTAVSFILFLLNFLLNDLRIFKSLTKILIVFLYFFSSVYIFLRIVIIPYPFYQAWLIFVQNRTSGGIISYIFIFLISYFITLFGGLIFHFGFLRPIAAVILVFSIMMSISFQNSGYSSSFFIIITISVILCLLSLTLIPYRKKLLPFFSSLRILLITLMISFVLFLLTYSKSGWLSEYSLVPDFKNLIKSFIPDLPFLPEMDGHGNFFETKGLGGRLVLHRQPVFEVKAKPGEVLYLRTRVFQKYTGYGWERDAGLKKEGLNDPVLSNYNLNLDFIKIKLLADYYSLVPHTLDTESIRVEGYENGLFNYAGFDTGFELKLPLIKGGMFILGTGGKNDKGISDRKIYLNIPPVLRKKIENSGFNFKDASDETGILNKIKSGLASGYKYSINSKAVGLDEDFVDNFLFSEKRGYCEHFASSMAVLARFYGLPSRFVTGYLVSMPPDKDTAVCTGMMAHAWAEIYSKGGWTVWEATPPMDIMINDKMDLNELKNIYDRDALDQINEIFRYNAVKNINKAGIKYQKLIIYLLIFSAFIFAGAALFFTVNFYGRGRLKTAGPDSLSGEPKKERMQPYIKKLLKKTGGKTGLKTPDETGWLKWADEFKKHDPQFSGEIDFMTDIIIKNLYSENKEIDKKQLKIFASCLRKIK